MLTEAQKHHFETLGFLCLRDFFPADELQRYTDAFDETLKRAKGLKTLEINEERRTIGTLRFFESNPAVYHPLLDGDKLNELIEDLLGEEYVFTVSEGALRTNNTRWHHDDVAPEGHRHLKVIFYLEPVRATTGCLCVLPGSHFFPYRERMEKYGEDILPLGKDVPGIYPIETDPGDLLVFNVKLYHSAFGEGAKRRGVYINFIQKPRTPEEAEYIKWLYRKDGGYYTPETFKDAPPRRLRMLQFLKEACYDSE